MAGVAQGLLQVAVGLSLLPSLAERWHLAVDEQELEGRLDRSSGLDRSGRPAFYRCFACSDSIVAPERTTSHAHPPPHPEVHASRGDGVAGGGMDRKLASRRWRTLWLDRLSGLPE